MEETITAIENSSSATDAAQKLGIARATIYWRLKQHGLKIKVIREKKLKVVKDV